MIVKSIYHKRLSFIIDEKSIGIDPNQVINVDENTGKKLLESPWITDNLAGKCSRCSDKKPIIATPKTPEVIPEIPEITEEKPKTAYQENRFEVKEKTIEKSIKNKKVEEKNS